MVAAGTVCRFNIGDRFQSRVPRGAARQRRFSGFSRKGRNQPVCEFVPDLCQTIAGLARLGGLVRRKNNNLRGISGRPDTDSVPGHHVFSSLQIHSPPILFHSVPIQYPWLAGVCLPVGGATRGRFASLFWFPELLRLEQRAIESLCNEPEPLDNLQILLIGNHAQDGLPPTAAYSDLMIRWLG